MLSNNFILCLPLLLLLSIFPSIRVFSNESVLHIRWPKYWNFSFSISLSNEYSGLISFRIDWLELIATPAAAAAAAKSLQSCPTLCDPVDGSPPGSPVPGILKARSLEWVAISFSRGSSRPRDGPCLSYISFIATGRRVLCHQCHLGSHDADRLR